MVSKVMGPIPTQQTYEKSDPETYMKVAFSNVKSDAEGLGKQGCGSLCLAVEVDRATMPSAFRKTKNEAKDHLKENVRRLREIQKRAQKKVDTEETQPVKALWKLAQFEGVESKVKENLQKSTLASRPPSANYLRAHSRTGFPPQSARVMSTEPADDKLTVPRASTARNVQLIRREINFLRVNSLAARQSPAMHRSPSVSALDEIKKGTEDDDKSYKRGEVPQYLLDRKKKWEIEERARRANIPDPDMPPGHRLMPDDERRETLSRIKQKQHELIAELSSMPICNDTLRVRRKREELEQKLAKVEEAVKIFSRQKVFVKLDS